MAMKQWGDGPESTQQDVTGRWPYAPLDTWLPLKTPHQPHCFIPVSLLKHFQGFCCWYPSLTQNLPFALRSIIQKRKCAHVRCHKDAYSTGPNVDSVTAHRFMRVTAHSCCTCMTLPHFVRSQEEQSQDVLIALIYSKKGQNFTMGRVSPVYHIYAVLEAFHHVQIWRLFPVSYIYFSLINPDLWNIVLSTC